MSDWRDKATKELNERMESTGRPVEDCAPVIVDQFTAEIMLEAADRLLKTWKKGRQKAWEEPADDLPVHRLSFGGEEFAISDAPIRWVDEDREERFKPARYSTGEEREASLAARGQHHAGWLRRTEAEQQRETRQNAAASVLGVDLYGSVWEDVAVDVEQRTCWRCGEGAIAGIPWQKGHVDNPKIHGGVEVAWEHRRCNASAQDNPVSDRQDGTEPF